MFEILKALRDLNEACAAHDTSLRWYVQHDEPGFPVLMAEIPITEDDQKFVDDMQAMFAPRKD